MATKTHIMKSVAVEKLADELHMPSLPIMVFGDNVLRIQHGFGIEFSATDAESSLCGRVAGKQDGG